MRLLRVSVSLLVVLTLATAAFTQTATTSLRGTVMDPNRGVIPGAKVTIKNASTGYARDVVTDGQGFYQFLQVPPGTYDIAADAKGTGSVTAKAVQLLVSQPATVDLTVKLSATTTVEVVGTAPVVNTTDATIGNAFNTQQILALPFEGRNAVEILSLQPGVAYTGNQVDTSFDSRNGSVNGARQDQTNITLDGVDNNDQNNGAAFQGALRSTLDSVQEFRVTTTNSNADSGRSSGAQVQLVTKSGTNNIHGSLYEYHRPTFGVANDYFVKKAQLESGLPNISPKLIRNTFGGAIGGPILKDRFFYFFNYEGQRRAETQTQTRIVPSDALRNGFISYECSDDPTCPASGVRTLSPAEIATMDPNCTGNGTCPLGPGVNPAVLAMFQTYPHANSDVTGDGFNFRGFTFAAPVPARLNTFVGKFDVNLSENGNHRLFVRGILQDDNSVPGGAGGISPQSTGPQQFPGQPSALREQANSKGIAIGYTAIVSPTLINNFRYGYTRLGDNIAGIGTEHHVTLRGLSNPQSFSRSTFVAVPVNNFSDDVTWTKGKHTFGFGANWRIINNDRTSNFANFFTSSSNPSWLNPSGIAGNGGDLDPGAFGFPAVNGDFTNSYDFPMGALAGLVPEIDATYNQDKTGAVIPEGQMIRRRFHSNELELYGQDSWRVKPNLTLTFGLRYSLLQPPYEVNGEQAAPTISLDDWFKRRGEAMLAGHSLDETLQFDISGQANGKKPYWGWDYGNWAPRFAFAYSPGFENGVLGKIFGGPSKTSIRGGWGLYYDHFGEGVVNTFDTNGSFGLTTTITNAPNFQTIDCTPRFINQFDIPTSVIGCGGSTLTAPPPGPFPVTPPSGFDNGSFAIYWGLNDRLKTPASHAIDFSVTREIGKDFAIETAYVGRLGRKLLQQLDLALPLNITDPSSKMDYFTAMTMLSKQFDAGVPESSIAAIPYFENLFPTAAGAGGIAGCDATAPGAPTATQNMYDLLSCGLRGNETAVLQIADLFCFPGCATLDGVTKPFQYYDDQFSSLYAWSSIGSSSYHAGQLMLRKRMSHGFQFDFNYTFSKSMDQGSDAERIDFVSGPGDEIINSWNPRQNRAVSTFDNRHQINTNYVVELPVGQRRQFGADMNKIADAFIGGWNLTGLMRWSSGFPFGVSNGANWATNWELSGYSPLKGTARPETGTFTDADGDPNVFKAGTDATSFFRLAYPGETGPRNFLRGPGYFGWDMGLNKTWKIRESQSVRFAWEVFNVFNSVRFDPLTVQPSIDGGGSFGKYNSTLTDRRKMQFSLRYDF